LTCLDEGTYWYNEAGLGKQKQSLGKEVLLELKQTLLQQLNKYDIGFNGN
jgi:hypothetical protein